MPTGEPPPSIFISYASQDREAARNLRDALAVAGFDVWYDESELGGGDAWDQKIRRQIRECRFFMPVISANANARHEGYFRREWKLAVDRSQDMADDVMFILPVAIDGTTQNQARVPDKFVSVQWLSVPLGQPTPAFQAWCKRLLEGENAPPVVSRPRQAFAAPAAAAPQREFPVFPEEVPGRKLHFLFRVVGWALQTAWVWYLRLPPRRRKLVFFLLVVILLGKTCSSSEHSRESTAEEKAKAQKLLEKLGQKLDPASLPKDGKTDLVKVGTEIATAISRDLEDDAGAEPDLLAVPFTAPPSDEASSRFAVTVFASVYGQLSIAAPSKVALAKPAQGDSSADPLKLARDRNADKVLFGAVQGSGDGLALEVTLKAADEGKVLWTGSFPLKGADPVAVADQIRSHIPPSK
jgi:TolB-like protein